MTKPSVVARFGWIMPEPFVMPEMITSPPFSATSACAILGTVSVVIIECATSGKRLSSRSSKRRGTAFTISVADPFPRRSHPSRRE